MTILSLNSLLSTIGGAIARPFLLTNQRFGQLIQSYLRFAETHIFTTFPKLLKWIPSFLLSLEREYLSNAESALAQLARYRRWFHHFMTTGQNLMDYCKLPGFHSANGCPLILLAIVQFLRDNMLHSKIWIVYSFVWMVLHIDVLGPSFVVSAFLTYIKSFIPTLNISDFSSHSVITSGMAVLNIVPSDLFTTLSNYFIAVRGSLFRGLGPNGPLGWSSVHDARALLNSPLSEELEAFVGVFGAQKFMTFVSSASKLPMIGRPLAAIHNYSINVDVSSTHGIRFIVAVNYWLLVLLQPFLQTINSIITARPNLTHSNDMAWISQLTAMTASRQQFLFSINVCDNLNMSPGTFASFLNALFGSSFGERFIAIYSPSKVYDLSSSQDIDTPGLILRNVFAIRQLIILYFIIVIEGSAACAGITDTTSKYHFSQDGSFVIHDQQLYEAVLANISSLGLSFGRSSLSIIDSHATYASWAGLDFLSGHVISGFSLPALNCIFVNGSNSHTIQLTGQVSGLFDNADMFWKWILALLPQQDSKYLTFLNTLPSTISGLPSALLHNSMVALAATNWMRGLAINPKDLIELFIYTVIVETLNRLDNTIRLSMNIPQFVQMVAARGNLESYLDTEGREQPVSSVDPSQFNVDDHPMYAAIDSALTDIIVNLFLICSAEESDIRSAINRSLDSIILLSSINSTVLDMGHVTLLRSLISKVLKLSLIINQPEHKGLLTHTTRLPGYGHPFVVSFRIGERTTISTTGFIMPSEIINPKLSGLSALTFFDPYGL